MQDPHAPKDVGARRLARSHAVKQALRSKRNLQQKVHGNFFSVMLQHGPGRSVVKGTQLSQTLARSPFSLSADALDPFNTLAVDSSRLKVLLKQCEYSPKHGLQFLKQKCHRYS